ncbi:MAG: hypothetical protein QXK37_03605 [Candidatus Woesearchaeota archaeon]
MEKRIVVRGNLNGNLVELRDMSDLEYLTEIAEKYAELHKNNFFNEYGETKGHIYITLTPKATDFAISYINSKNGKQRELEYESFNDNREIPFSGLHEIEPKTANLLYNHVYAKYRQGVWAPKP